MKFAGKCMKIEKNSPDWGVPIPERQINIRNLDVMPKITKLQLIESQSVDIK